MPTVELMLADRNAAVGERLVATITISGGKPFQQVTVFVADEALHGPVEAASATLPLNDNGGAVQVLFPLCSAPGKTIVFAFYAAAANSGAQIARSSPIPVTVQS